MLVVCQPEREHQLDACQQGVEIPHDGGLVPQLHVVGGRIALKGGDASLVQPKLLRFFCKLHILVIQECAHEGECPVPEDGDQPVVPFTVAPHEGQCHCFRLVMIGHHDGKRGLVRQVNGAAARVNGQRNRREGKEVIQIRPRVHDLFPNERILREVHLLVAEKLAGGRQRGHQSQQTILTGKLPDQLLQLVLRSLVHTLQADVQRIQQQLIGLLQRVIRPDACFGGGCQVLMPILGGAPFVIKVSYPAGAEMLKNLIHNPKGDLHYPAQVAFRMPAPNLERKIEMMNMKNKPVVIGIDHGYGNMKTAHCCFRTGIMPIDGNEPVFSSDILTYDGKSYVIGQGHKEFTADKMLDQDYYLLTLAAIARELHIRNLTTTRVVLAVGLLLTLGVHAEGELPGIPHAA